MKSVNLEKEGPFQRLMDYELHSMLVDGDKSFARCHGIQTR